MTRSQILRSYPCIVCAVHGEKQLSPTTEHHWFHDRGGNFRTPDAESIPLCDGHHQGHRDTSTLAIHQAKEQWREKYGADFGYVELFDAVLAYWGEDVPPASEYQRTATAIGWEKVN